MEADGNAENRVLAHEPSPCLIWLIIISASLGAVSRGYDTAIVNGAIFQLHSSFGFELESWTSGFIVALAIGGAIVGSFLGSVTGNRLGRKNLIIIGDFIFIVGSLLLSLATSITYLFVGRFIVGVGVGLASIMIPMYLAEIVNPQLRGRAITLSNFAVTGGQCLAACLAMWIVLTSLLGEHGWRLMFGLGAVPAILQLLLMCYLPESPRWLSMRGRDAEAQRVKIKLMLQDVPRQDHTTANVDCAMLCEADSRRRLTVGCFLQFAQQFAGINTVMYYSSTILHEAGFHGAKDPIIFSVPLAACNSLFTIVGFFAVDRFGRRKLLMASLTGCFFSLIAMSLNMSMPREAARDTDTVSTCGWLSMACLTVYICSFAPGAGPVPWVVNAEIYPMAIRSNAVGIATMVNFASNAAVSQLFPVVIKALGSGYTFLLLSILCFAFVIICYKIMPETKDIPLEQMGAVFAKQSKHWRRPRSESGLSDPFRTFAPSNAEAVRDNSMYALYQDEGAWGGRY